MKIRFVDSVAGANFSYRRNQVVDLRVDLAKQFLTARQAVEVKEQAVAGAPERAVASGPIETATEVVPATRGRGGRRKNGVLSSLFGGGQQ